MYSLVAKVTVIDNSHNNRVGKLVCDTAYVDNAMFI